MLDINWIRANAAAADAAILLRRARHPAESSDRADHPVSR